MLTKLKQMNLKAIVRAFSIIWMFILIVTMTILNLGFDKDFNWMTWLSNTLILFGITVFGLLIGESSGTDFQKGKRDGIYQRNINAYDTFRASIDDIILWFPLFYDWFIPKRIERKNIEFLVRGGMHIKKAESIVRYCSLEDLFELKSHAIEKEVDGKKIHIKKLLEKEVRPVEMVLKGEIVYKQSGAAYYLQALAESNQADIMEVGQVIKESRKKTRRVNRIIRICSGVVISLIVGALTVKEMMKGNDAQAWMNLVSRITNLITALACGFLSGVDDVIKQADAIENKTNVLKLFKQSYDKKLFEVYDEEEGARREYEEYEKHKQESIENVVDNDIMMIEEKKEGE